MLIIPEANSLGENISRWNEDWWTHTGLGKCWAHLQPQPPASLRHNVCALMRQPVWSAETYGPGLQGWSLWGSHSKEGLQRAPGRPGIAWLPRMLRWERVPGEEGKCKKPRGLTWGLGLSCDFLSPSVSGLPQVLGPRAQRTLWWLLPSQSVFWLMDSLVLGPILAILWRSKWGSDFQLFSTLHRCTRVALLMHTQVGHTQDCFSGIWSHCLHHAHTYRVRLWTLVPRETLFFLPSGVRWTF